MRIMSERTVHLVPAGIPLGLTLCGLPIETPDRPWEPGLVPDYEWTGPFGKVTCPNCLATEEAGE